MKTLLVLGFVALDSATAVAKTISTAGTTLSVPGGWHAAIARTPRCDPERLAVVSSAPIHIARGRLALPPEGNVLILLLEDRYAEDRPVGDLRRPSHFTIDWNRPVRLKAICGNPDAPAFMHYVKTRGRYVGFIVYAPGQVEPTVRRKTLFVMDSLRVA